MYFRWKTRGLIPGFAVKLSQALYPERRSLWLGKKY
jgi:hypothetical protein